jgi:hypothetical protein
MPGERQYWLSSDSGGRPVALIALMPKNNEKSSIALHPKIKGQYDPKNDENSSKQGQKSL